MKKHFILAAAVLLSSMLFAKTIDTKISGLDFTKQMGFGWNLGNTLDATGGTDLNSERSWGQPFTTKEMIDGIAASGIKTIRIPVAWHNHIVNKKNAYIDPAWMARVKQIVDWAIDDGLYVILNTHHDNADKPETALKASDGYYPDKASLKESEKFLYNVWNDISRTFNNDYDEHLIFETLNEPRPKATSHEWNYRAGCSVCKEAIECINDFNQLIVNTIRASGGNNAYRFIAVPSVACSLDSLLSDDFVLPEDSAGRIIAAVHLYTPYSFAMDPNPSLTKFTDSYRKNLSETFNKLNKKFISNGIPVYIGEMGAVNKNNLSEREAWFRYFVSNAHALGIPAILWDNGNFDSSDNKFEEKYGFYCRMQAKWYFPSLIEIAVESAGTKAGSIPLYDATYEYGYNEDDAITILEDFDTKDWSNSTVIPKYYFDDLKEGSIIKIVTVPSAAKEKSYRVLSFRDTSWKDLPYFTGTVYGEGSIHECNVNPKADKSVYYWFLSAQDAAILKKQNVLVCGNNVKIQSLSIQF